LDVENQEVEHGIEVDEETKFATCWIASATGKACWMGRGHWIGKKSFQPVLFGETDL
jgi:hypothetical protein